MKIFLSTILLVFLTLNAYSADRPYKLVISRGDVEINGQLYKDRVLVNNQFPAPKLDFIYGETAVVEVKNNLSDKTLIHWHGLLIKNDQDGVPYVNSLPIEPGATKIYRFKIIQTGTYWYHSHVMFQEEDGLYGAFIIHPEENQIAMPEETIVLSDLSKETGEQIQKNLKKDGEYYDVLKGTVQSWVKAFKQGSAATKFRNSLQRMEGMDYADIAYDEFLANSRPKIELYKNDLPSDGLVRLRIINGSATSIYKLTFAGDFFTVVGADGLEVRPVKVKTLPISVAETYDVIVKLSENRQLELRATSLDNTGWSSILLGKGNLVHAPMMSWHKPIGMTMGHMMGMKQMSFWKEFSMNYRNEFSDLPSKMTSKVSEYQPPSEQQLKGMMSSKMDHGSDHMQHSSMNMK